LARNTKTQLGKLIKSATKDNIVKENNELTTGNKHEIMFWFNRGWILPKDFKKTSYTPSDFVITQLAINSYEYIKIRDESKEPEFTRY
jgi:hypothetical protein